MRDIGQLRRLLPFLMLLLSLPKTAFPLFFAYGRCFNYDGTSGTASDAPSFASLALYRHGIDGQIGRQNGSSNPASDEALFEAGSGLPAYFLSDVDTPGQWSTNAALGQGVVAVLECRPGQFGWNGPALLAWASRVLSPGDLGASTANMGSLTLKFLPQPAIFPGGPGQIELRWDAPADPSGLLSSYTVYRASFAAPAPAYRYAPGQALAKTAKMEDGQVRYKDSPPPGLTWHYRIAANLAWQPETEDDDLDGGALPNKPYYVSFGQSEEAVAPLPSLTSTPPAAAPDYDRPRMGPVPARRGEKICLPIPGASFDIYTLGGEAAARVESGPSGPCLETRAFAPGVYLARVKVMRPDGSQHFSWQKIALVP